MAMFERANGQQDVHFPSMEASTKYKCSGCSAHVIGSKGQ